MTITFEITAYGEAAHDALAVAVGVHKATDPLKPVTVIVPSNYIGIACRRALANRRGVAAVDITTLYRLADRLGSGRLASSKRRPVSTPLLAGATRAVLGSEPGRFAGVQHHHSTERSLIKAHRALAELPPNELAQLAAKSPRTADVVRIFHAVNAKISQHFFNEQDLIAAAIQAIHTNANVLNGLGLAILFLPERCNHHQIAMLKALKDKAELHVIAASSGVAEADNVVKNTVQQLGGTWSPSTPRSPARPDGGAHIAQPPPPSPSPSTSASRTRPDGGTYIAQPPPPPPSTSASPSTSSSTSPSTSASLTRPDAGTHIAQPPPTPPSPSASPSTSSSASPSASASIEVPIASSAISVSDADDEVRQALRKIIEAARQGTPLARCAVLYGSHEPYSATIADAFAAAGIEWCGRSTQTSASSLMGRFVLNMLALDPEDLSRLGVFAWLAGAPVRTQDRRLAPTAAWERVARAAGVVRGREQWKSRLDRFHEDRLHEAESFRNDPEQQWRVRRLETEAQRAEQLVEFVTRLSDDLSTGSHKRTWRELANWCKGLVTNYLGNDTARQGWPEPEQSFAERVLDAINKIGELDGIDPNPGVTAFRNALALQLGDDLKNHGTFGTGVLVSPVTDAVGLELDLAIVLGLAEGTMPSRQRDDPLLPDNVRGAGSFGLATQADRTNNQHRCLLAVMAAAKHTLVLFPRGDLRKSAQRSPSRWLLDTCQARDAVRPSAEELARETGDWLVEVPSFVAGLRSTSFPAHAQEYDMRALLDWTDDDKPVNQAPPLLQRREIRLGVDLITNRSSSRLTRFDGNLQGRLSAESKAALRKQSELTSASRLEKWAQCPHAYFVRHVLGVDAVEDPSEQHRITALDFGTLVHRVLEHWISEAQTNGTLPSPNQAWSETQVERLTAIGNAEAARLEERGLVGHSVYWQRHKRIFLHDLLTFSAADSAARKHNQTTPYALELRFGMPASQRAAVPLILPNGQRISLRGAIDRLDVGADGHLLVLDYKTGSTRKYNNLDADPLRGGTVLQLVLYAVAARQLLNANSRQRECPQENPIDGMYWFVTRKSGFEFCGYRVTEALETEGLQTVANIIEGIESGLFPAHPAAPGFRTWVDCDSCEPDGLGLSHQHSDWLRKQNDPDLAPYIAIIGDDNA